MRYRSRADNPDAKATKKAAAVVGIAAKRKRLGYGG